MLLLLNQTDDKHEKTNDFGSLISKKFSALRF